MTLRATMSAAPSSLDHAATYQQLRSHIVPSGDLPRAYASRDCSESLPPKGEVPREAGGWGREQAAQSSEQSSLDTLAEARRLPSTPSLDALRRVLPPSGED